MKKITFTTLLLATFFLSANAQAIEFLNLIHTEEVVVEAGFEIENLRENPPGFLTSNVFTFAPIDNFNIKLGYIASFEKHEKNNFTPYMQFVTAPIHKDIIKLLLSFRISTLNLYDAYTFTPAVYLKYDNLNQTLPWGLFSLLELNITPPNNNIQNKIQSEPHTHKHTHASTLTPTLRHAPSPQKSNNTAQNSTHLSLQNQTGAFICLPDEHHILVENTVSYDMNNKNFNWDSLALGYNFELVHNVELINEVSFKIPTNKKEEFNASLEFELCIHWE